MTFTLDVISPIKRIFSGEVKKITIPSIDGQLTILPNHMPYVTPLGMGEVIVDDGKSQNYYSIGKGFFSILKNQSYLLIEDVSSVDEIFEEKVLLAKKKAQELIDKGVQGEDKLAAIYSLRRSLVDLNIILRRKKRIVSS